MLDVFCVWDQLIDLYHKVILVVFNRQRITFFYRASISHYRFVTKGKYPSGNFKVEGWDRLLKFQSNIVHRCRYVVKNLPLSGCGSVTNPTSWQRGQVTSTVAPVRILWMNLVGENRKKDAMRACLFIWVYVCVSLSLTDVSLLTYPSRTGYAWDQKVAYFARNSDKISLEVNSIILKRRQHIG